MHKMSFHQLTINSIKQEQLDSISQLLFSLGTLSITYLDNDDQPIYEPEEGQFCGWQNNRIKALFAEEVNLDEILIALTLQCPNIIQNCHLAKITDQDWQRVCLKYFAPMQFAQKLWVCPSWCKPVDDSATNIMLDPGLAFGTGTHATTALCLQWLGENNIKDKTVIDYGCGSGILAIAAAKLGAKKVFAVDNHPQALLASKQNAEYNSIKHELLSICHSNEPLATLADIIVANILLEPLLSLTEKFVNLLKPGGTLILSGILAEQKQLVIEKYRPYMQSFVVTEKEQWLRIVAVKIVG